MSELQKIKIWDPISRLWHWMLAIVVGVGWVFGEFMSFQTIVWHFYLGYVTLGLLGFRLIWGLVGPAPIRWGNLFPRPSRLIAYSLSLAKREPSGVPGHNPLGALSVLVLLLLLLFQAGSGLFLESEDFFEAAPLYGTISDALTDKLTWWHHFLSKVLLGMVGLHLTAILYYWIWKKENLISPMLTGWKWVKKRYQTERK